MIFQLEENNQIYTSEESAVPQIELLDEATYSFNSEIQVKTKVDIVIENQLKIMKELAKIQTLLEVLELNKKQDDRSLKIEIGLNFKPINTLEELKKFSEEIANPIVFDSYFRSMSVICGVQSKCKGIDHCYSLVDKFFTRKFFTLCSWAGGAKIPHTKFAFKSYENIISLFFKLVHQADESFTLEQCEVFFKNVIKNSVRRNESSSVRCSKSKNRPKKLNYKIKMNVNGDENLDEEAIDLEDINEFQTN